MSPHANGEHVPWKAGDRTPPFGSRTISVMQVQEPAPQPLGASEVESGTSSVYAVGDLDQHASSQPSLLPNTFAEAFPDSTHSLTTDAVVNRNTPAN